MWCWKAGQIAKDDEQLEGAMFSARDCYKLLAREFSRNVKCTSRISTRGVLVTWYAAAILWANSDARNASTAAAESHK